MGGWRDGHVLMLILAKIHNRCAPLGKTADPLRKIALQCQGRKISLIIG